ncbi:50S ribosomal protein L30e [Candidatus Micrarchaeota archaeon]|nr:50S ribosomal protein L30e [Candidatus Micrarchaeota archaeon]
MDIVKAIRMAVDTGKVEFGSRKALKHAMHGDCKLIIIAKNCPKDIRNDIEYYSRLSGVKTVVFDGDNDELAEACGKPFNISTLTILDPGDSEILNIYK